MPVGYEDHRGVPLTVAVTLGGGDQSLDLTLGKMLPGPQGLVRGSPWGNCSFYDGWGD